MAAKAGAERAAFALVRWIAGKTDGKVAADLSDNVLRDAFRARKTGGTSALRDAEKAAGCALCFPAGTLVATARGAQAIQTLHVGNVVQAENPTTGKVEAEAVQAVIADPVSPLIAVNLSDGSAITVTADHPFWVDSGARLAGAGWFAAGRLQAGDELRTASGAHVMVVGLRHNVGHAVVYTLTVAKDHTFFVGSAQVLVHNAGPCGSLRISAARLYHVIARHLSNSSLAYAISRAGKVAASDLKNGPGDSQFFSHLSVSELRQLIVDAFDKAHVDAVWESNGKYYRALVKLDRDIGYDKYGRITPVVRIVVTAAGDLVTIFPDI